VQHFDRATAKSSKDRASFVLDDPVHLQTHPQGRACQEGRKKRVREEEEGEGKSGGEGEGEG
jgi:hypothetical protein